MLRTRLEDEEDTYVIHAIDPTGFGIKFIGKGESPPKHTPTETGFCKSNDGCFAQGLCWTTQENKSSEEFVKEEEQLIEEDSLDPLDIDWDPTHDDDGGKIEEPDNGD